MKDDLVLNYLKDNLETHSSGEEISRKLKVSRAAIWKHIQNLRKLGYEIDGETHRGYKLIKTPDKLFADEISYKLGTKIFGQKTILSYASLDSTNTNCFKLGEEGVPEGALVLAEHQKKGRGRLGRQWVSPKEKNVLISILLRPILSPAQVPKITLIAATSLARVIHKLYSIKVGIKWPNDILCQEKKLCGILTEMSAESDRVNFVVLGIGINVNAQKEELPPEGIALSTILGKSVSRVEFLREFLKELEKDYLRLKSGNFKTVIDDWEKYSATSGKRVRVDLLGKKIEGSAMGIDEEGALWIRRDNGLQEKITAGDVQHLRSA